MFDGSAVLVLGAGASAPFGYPIGPKLIENIVEGLQNLSPTLEDQIENDTAPALHFLTEPYVSLVTYIMTRRPPNIPSEFYGSIRFWKKLADELHNTSHQSIDEFARTNPGRKRVVKLLIAAEIAKHSFDAKSFASRNKLLRASPALTANARANWYGKLVAHLRRHYPSTEAFKGGNTLSVVTFNYDRSLEQFLETELSRAEIYADLDWRDAVSVIHVHGMLDFSAPCASGMSPTGHFADCLFKSAEDFLVIDDKRAHQDPALIARRVLHDADQIVVLGFDFHPSNVDLIGLDKPQIAAKVRTLNYTGRTAFDRKAERAGVLSEAIFRGGANYEIAAAIDDGIFDF